MGLKPASPYLMKLVSKHVKEGKERMSLVKEGLWEEEESRLIAEAKAARASWEQDRDNSDKLAKARDAETLALLEPPSESDFPIVGTNFFAADCEVVFKADVVDSQGRKLHHYILSNPVLGRKIYLGMEQAAEFLAKAWPSRRYLWQGQKLRVSFQDGGAGSSNPYKVLDVLWEEKTLTGQAARFARAPPPPEKGSRFVRMLRVKEREQRRQEEREQRRQSRERTGFRRGRARGPRVVPEVAKENYGRDQGRQGGRGSYASSPRRCRPAKASGGVLSKKVNKSDSNTLSMPKKASKNQRDPLPAFLLK